MFRAHAVHFATWGILYDTISYPTDQPRLKILTLPPVIFSRLHTEPRLLIDLLRTEIYTLTESGSIPSTSTANSTKDTKDTWLQRIASCPKGILSLLNSRACRSAIMFNDKLEKQQCQELVEGVAKTKFPFICAHGRNSMVPLVYLDGEEGVQRRFGEEKREESEGFGVAFRKWRNKAAGV
jgi:DNA mismatch repair protein MLH3